MSRDKTRRERYDLKAESFSGIPLIIATVNFKFDDNIAFLIRSAACFGVSRLLVIGSVPDRGDVNSKSGSLFDYVDIEKFSSPRDFLDYCQENRLSIISAEITEGSRSVFDYNFDFSEDTVLVLGNETFGVPTEILLNSDIIHIPMPGVGYCLNTSQAGTAILTEYTRRYGAYNEEKTL
jgi:tRNA G18 (ribose-2'-O)-methylase SpoU